MTDTILLIGISVLPTLTGSIATLPLWFERSLTNEKIKLAAACLLFFVLTGIMTLSIDYIFDIDNCHRAVFCLTLCWVNLPLFQLYTRILDAWRCRYCRLFKFPHHMSTHLFRQWHCKCNFTGRRSRTTS